MPGLTYQEGKSEQVVSGCIVSHPSPKIHEGQSGGLGPGFVIASWEKGLRSQERALWGGGFTELYTVLCGQHLAPHWCEKSRKIPVAQKLWKIPKSHG